MMMTRRKGELSGARIDREWPHQVAIEARFCAGVFYGRHREFCKAHNLTLCERGHSVVYDDRWFCVFCFSDKEHAETFRLEFNGERFNPKDRGRGHKWMMWYKGRHKDGVLQQHHRKRVSR